MELHITRVFRSDKDKNGNALVNKDGNPYEKLAIKCREYGDKWVSGFSGKWNAHWKEGDVVTAEVVPNGDYLNLKRPDPFADMSKAIMDLNVRVGKLDARIKLLEGGRVPDDDIPVVAENPNIPYDDEENA